MKKIYLIFMLFILGIVSVGCNSKSSEFNNIKWETQKETIIKKLGPPVSNDDNNILYHDFFMDNSCDVWYCFDSDNKLNRINVNFKDAVIYNDLKDDFTEKYGKPKNEENDSDLRVAEWGIGHTTINVFLFDGESHAEYSYSETPYASTNETEDLTEEEETVDNLKIEVTNTYNNLYDIADKADDLYVESVKAITDDSISRDEAYKITSKNDGLASQYLDEVSKYLDSPTYDDDYAFAVYEYITSIKTITLGCCSYALSGNSYYLGNAKIEVNNIMDKYNKVMTAQREMPEKAGYSLVDIIVDAHKEETT